MRVTISHKKTKEDAKREVDLAVDHLFQGLPVKHVQILDQKKHWEGSTLVFTLTAKVAFISNPIKGTIEVTDKDLTIDADLGMLNHLIPESKIRSTMEAQVRKLLPSG